MRFLDFFMAVVAFTAAVGIVIAINPYNWKPINLEFPVYNYESGYTPTSTMIAQTGDVFWGVNQTLTWISKTIEVSTSIVSMLGIPSPVATALVYIATILFSLFLIYMITGRTVMR